MVIALMQRLHEHNRVAPGQKPEVIARRALQESGVGKASGRGKGGQRGGVQLVELVEGDVVRAARLVIPLGPLALTDVHGDAKLLL